MNFNDAREAIVGLLGTLALVAGAITFILWLYRAYQNADAVAPGTRRYGKGWAIAGWFVPIMWLFRPKQVINDVWRAGGPPHEPSGLLAAWWTLWIIGMWVSNFALRRAFDDVTAESVRTASISYAVSGVIDIVTAILAIRVAMVITERLDERAKNGPPQPRRFDRDESMTSAFPTAGVGRGPAEVRLRRRRLPVSEQPELQRPV